VQPDGCVPIRNQPIDATVPIDLNETAITESSPNLALRNSRAPPIPTVTPLGAEDHPTNALEDSPTSSVAFGMDRSTYEELERAWAIANKEFKRLDAEFKNIEQSRQELQERVKDIEDQAPKSRTAELFLERKEKIDELRAARDSEVEAVYARAEEEEQAIAGRYELLLQETDRGFQHQVGAIIGLSDESEVAAFWEEYSPEDEVISQEREELLVEIQRLGVILGELSGPRIVARRALNAARSDKLHARRLLDSGDAG